MPWQAIETVPKDGEQVLFWMPDAAGHDVVIGWWDEEEDCCYERTHADGSGQPIDVEVTHWAPIPELP